MNPSWGSVMVATAVAWTGALIAALLRDAGSRVMRPLVYFALLFFGLSAIFDILPMSKEALSWPMFVVAVGAGYLLFWLASHYIAPICPACAMRNFDHDHHHHHQHAHGTGLAVIAFVLGSHCFLDGLGVGAASTVGASFGWRVFAAIAVHKLPEGFALGLMLMPGRRSAWHAFGWAAAIELATLGGALASAVWTHPSVFWLSLILAHIGGTFLYLSINGLWDAFSPLPRLAVRRP